MLREENAFSCEVISIINIIGSYKHYCEGRENAEVKAKILKIIITI